MICLYGCQDFVEPKEKKTRREFFFVLDKMSIKRSYRRAQGAQTQLMSYDVLEKKDTQTRYILECHCSNVLERAEFSSKLLTATCKYE